MNLPSIQRHTDLGSTAAQEHLRLNPHAKRGLNRRKYSMLQLDEAVKYAATHGLKAAQEMTGVSIASIKKHAVSIKRRGKDAAQVQREFVGKKYEARQLTYAIERALKLFKAGYGPFSKCLKKASELTGVGYGYLRVVYSKGLVPFNDDPQ